MSDDPLFIAHLGARGDGVATTSDGRAIYVPFAAPGDRISIEGDVIERGPHYKQPECPHFGECGGCALQHVDAPSYENWLQDRIRQALRQHGLSCEILKPHISPPGARRRAAFQARWEKGQLHLGYSKPRSHDVIDLTACPVLMPDLLKTLEPIRAVLRTHLDRRASARLELTMTATGVDVMLDAPLDATEAAFRQELSEFAESLRLCRFALRGADGLVDVIVQRRLPFIRLSDVPVVLPVGAFLQATQDGEEALVETVCQAVGTDARRILDLFSGIGTFSFPLAALGNVHAVEGWRDALDAMNQAGATQKAISLEHRDLFRRPMTVKELNAYDAVVFDPPRAGAKAQAPLLAQSSVQKVIAVSCNPNTFARDAEELVKGGFTLEWVKPVGQFLWSKEVELVALFQR